MTADIAYLDISDSGKQDFTGPLGLVQGTVKADIEFQQLLLEVPVGYRVLDRELEHGRISVDAQAGPRYNWIKVELGAEVSVLGLTSASDRERTEQWVDGLFGFRAEYLANARWSLSGWADYGIGADSHSYHWATFVNYLFGDGLELSGGFRQYHMDRTTGSGSSRLKIDLDYTGPMLGLTYTF